MTTRYGFIYFDNQGTMSGAFRSNGGGLAKLDNDDLLGDRVRIVREDGEAELGMNGTRTLYRARLVWKRGVSHITITKTLDLAEETAKQTANGEKSHGADTALPGISGYQQRANAAASASRAALKTTRRMAEWLGEHLSESDDPTTEAETDLSASGLDDDAAPLDATTRTPMTAERADAILADLPEFSCKVYAAILLDHYAEAGYSDVTADRVATRLKTVGANGATTYEKGNAINAAIGHLQRVGLVETQEGYEVEGSPIQYAIESADRDDETWDDRQAEVAQRYLDYHEFTGEADDAPEPTTEPTTEPTYTAEQLLGFIGHQFASGATEVYAGALAPESYKETLSEAISRTLTCPTCKTDPTKAGAGCVECADIEDPKNTIEIRLRDARGKLSIVKVETALNPIDAEVIMNDARPVDGDPETSVLAILAGSALHEIRPLIEQVETNVSAPKTNRADLIAALVTIDVIQDTFRNLATSTLQVLKRLQDG